MSGEELRQLLLERWGYSYDLQLRRVGTGASARIQLQVMWRYLEQASFPLTESEYLEHLQSIARHLSDWGADLKLREFLRDTKARPRLGKPVVMVIDLGSRSIEWLV